MLIKIHDISEDGRGIGRTDEGLVVFVPGTYPGDIADVEVRVEEGARSASGKLISIAEQSPDRIDAPCKYFEECGGCALMGLSYDAQLAIKQKHVEAALERIGGFKAGADYVLNDILHQDCEPNGSPLRYRNKAEFAIEGNRIAYRKRGSHELLEADDCLLVPKPVMDAVKDKRAELKPTQKYFKRLTVRINTDGDIMLVTDNSDKTITSDRRILKDEIVTKAGTLKTEISPQSFYQINPSACNLLYSKVQDYANLSGGETVLDLYCGAGSIGLSMASRCSRVIGVESVKPAVIDANRNAVINGIVNATFICGKAEDVIDTKLQGIKADVVIVDPPRAGCKSSLLEAIKRIAPKRLIYVSCNPSTLARDLKLLCDPTDPASFKLQELTPVDMFPHTLHVETITLLSHQNIEEKVYVDYEPDNRYMKNVTINATYKEIQKWIKDNYGFKVHTLYIAQIKRKYGIDMGECYNPSKKENPVVQVSPPKTEEAIIAALKYFRMID